MRIILIIIAFIAFIVLLDSPFIVTQTQQALVLEFGKVNDMEKDVITKPGLYWKIPYIQKVIKYDNRVLDLNAEPTKVIDKNLEPLEVDAFVKYKITDPLKFYQRVQTERRANERLGTFLETSLRQEMGGHEIALLLTKARGGVMENIAKDVKEKAKEIGVDVVDVRIMRADYPKENTEYVYRSMRTSREEEARRYRAEGAQQSKVVRSKAEKRRTFILADAGKNADIIRGEGDASVVQIFADAFGKDKKFYEFYRSMQAYKTSLNEDNTTMVISPNSDFFKFFDSAKAGK